MATQHQTPYEMQQTSYENTSGMGDAAIIPPGVKGWSWGAFCLNFIWGIGNSVYIALLCLIPLVNVVMIFVLGFKGREWAWRKRRWLNVEEFQKAQRKWSIAGFAVWALFLIGLPTLLHFMFAGQKELALKLIRENAELTALVGENVTTGWFVNGKMHADAFGSCAVVSMSVGGSKAHGTLRMASIGKGESWQVLQAELVTDDGKGTELTHHDFDANRAKLQRCLARE